ncbi:Afadin [Labeo rohita]|uniref:Afadin n=1 Tax=Labeo rohita TaxID=84645 RepID=A0ABQ8LNH8_LABRO|nr:Afadin [Labeo rohita]
MDTFPVSFKHLFFFISAASDRGRGDKGKMRPKSEGFELYNNSVQNGSPESPQGTWDTYPEPKKEDRLLKNRADHRSSPNVANQAQSPGGKPVYPGAPGKITSVSTGNLCPDEEPSPPRPEAYPIPTQTYPREYFTFPASKSQDRMGPGQPWQNNEPEPLPPMDNHSNNSMAMQRIARSQEELSEMPGGYPGERLRQEDLMHLQQQQREAEYPRGGGDHWNHQMSSSVESSTSSQEHLNFSSSSGSRMQGNHKSGPGRWKTPIAPHSGPVGVSQPSRSDLPPPPPPPPAHYDYEPQPDLPLPPPPSTTQQQAAAAAATADRKKREEQQRWYEKEKARLEEERDRKRRDQERKLVQIRNPPGPVMHNNQHGPLPPAPQHQQMPHQQPPMQVPQPYLPPVQPAQPPPPQPARPDKLSSLPRQPPQDTVIRDLLPQQQPRTIERRDLQYITISKEELSASDSLSPDPWKRDAREKLEKQQQLHIVDLLDKEIQDLQAKPERTAEENDRLRKLMLEWQFQKRLQESKQNEEDEEEEDDEDVDTTLIMQRLEAEKRARVSKHGKWVAGVQCVDMNR